MSLQSCTRTLDRLYASTRSVYAKWYWVNHGRLTSEQSCTRTLDRLNHGRLTSEQSCTRTLDRLSERVDAWVYAKWYWVNHGRLTSEQSSNTRQAANNHALEHSTGSERGDAFGLREMVLGKSRQAHQRTAGSPANEKLTFRYPSSLIQSLDAAARALKRQASCLLRVDAFATRRRGNHMHDHSRFQRDIDRRHRRLSLSLSTTHKSHSRTI